MVRLLLASDRFSALRSVHRDVLKKKERFSEHASSIIVSMRQIIAPRENKFDFLTAAICLQSRLPVIVVIANGTNSSRSKQMVVCFSRNFKY